jgi:hypothetical protein
MTGAKIFVATAFAILGASFLISTGLLIYEFQGADWVTMVMAHSHLFFFFPVFGLLALAAFYLPSVVFTDLYWHHLRFGTWRYFGGLIVLAIAAVYFADMLDTEPRAVWEASRAALAADRGEQVDCGNEAPCTRVPILDALGEMRKEAQRRIGLSKFSRTCTSDAMLGPGDDVNIERQCFPANAKLKPAACCEVQRHLADTLGAMQADPTRRSLAGTWDRVLLPFKVFFVLVVMAIGLLLAVWRSRLDEHYAEFVPAVEVGVIIGALAMLVWPAMDYGYQQTANVLFGRWQTGPQLRLSLVIGPWALLLMFYFLRRLGRQGETLAQVAAVVTAATAVLRYEDLNDWAARLLGLGAQPWVAYVLVIVAVAGFAMLLWASRPQSRIAERLAR